MSKKSIIVIGAGLSGLSAGCFACMNGFDAHIFEHHTVPGGVSAAWKRKGYLLDGGAHFLMGYKPGMITHNLYRELGIIPSTKLIEMPSYLEYVDEASGRRITLTADLDRFLEDCTAISRADRSIVEELVSGAKAIAGMDIMTGLDKAPEMETIWSKIKMYVSMWRFGRYFIGKYAKSISEFIEQVKDPYLRFIINTIFYPDVPVWFVIFLLRTIADRQMALFAEGSLAFARTIERRFKDLGGTVSYKSKIEKILVENDRAVGVRLDDGTEHRADYVVSAADGYSTIFTMLEGRYVNQKIKDRFNEMPLITPTMIVSFGVATVYKEAPWLSVIRLKRPFTIGDKTVDMLTVRVFNYSDAFAPPGKTALVVMADSEWDYWKDLREDLPRYQAEKERVANEVLSRLETQYPEITSKVEIRDVATPYTLWRYTFNHRGAYMGWLPTRKSLMTKIKRTLPGLSNFYMAGQWVVPGGGIPACLFSGRHAIELICRQEGRKFTTQFDS